MHNTYPSVILLHGFYRGLFHTVTDFANQAIGCTYNLAGTTIVLSHLYHTATGQHRQLLHIPRIGPSKLKNILIIITDSNNPHIFEIGHKSLDQCKIIRAHILRLINDQDCLAYLGWLHVTTRYHLCCSSYHIIGLIQIAYSPEQVKTIRMKSLDFDKMSGITNELHQALLELGSCRTGECKHKQLLMLDVFKQKKGSQFMNQHTSLATARSCCHHNTT